MAEVSLFRKWRSRTFADLVGQESVVRTLRNVLAGGSPARAYLFCGPRGTGKTSSARIFAKALCCENRSGLEPCDRCSTCKEIALGSCLDVFEIDAASHTQVEKIRDFIVDKVHFAPARAPFKVYIIDEVHKLSGASFNALLKTLEEPPAHVVFILATTHPHEVLPTILSRCQRYDFRPLSVLEIRARLAEVANAEGSDLHPDAAGLLARAADGSLRDALVLLEQALTFCGPTVGPDDLVTLLGLVPHVTLERLVERLLTQDTRALLELLQEQCQAGHDMSRFANSTLEHLRSLMLVRAGAHDSSLDSLPEAARDSLALQAEKVSMGQLMLWLKALLDLTQAIRDGGPARLLWEMAVVQLTTPATPMPAATSSHPAGMEALTARLERLERKLTEDAQDRPPEREAPRLQERAPVREARASRSEEMPPVRLAARSEEITPAGDAARAQPAPEAPAQESRPVRPSPAHEGATRSSDPGLKDFWRKLMNRLEGNKSNKNLLKLFAVLKEARLDRLDAGRVELSLPEKFKVYHFKVINESKPVLELECEQLLGEKTTVVCQLRSDNEVPSDEDAHSAMERKANSLFVGTIVKQ